jgi:ATP-dependent DNA ligase
MVSILMFLYMFLFSAYTYRWVFEKYDGVRGFWNPLKRLIYSRHGKPFNVPQKVIDAMPQDMFLDGELWYVQNKHKNL